MKMNELMIYQVFPLRALTDGQPSHGILEMIDWIPHIKKLGMNAVYFSPVFSSSDHGYDTKDYQKIDERLGTNEDFKKMCDAMHEEGIQVILDGVFNHVGREFFAFEDVREKKWDSPYKDWFYINFDGNSCYDDGFWYEGWEGHFELVKLNLDNEQVRNYLLESVGIWIDKLGIDGLRLDVAYMLNRNFMKVLVDFVHSKKPEFLMIGEMLHGDYTQLVNPELLDSVTNYECYKGLYSSHNTKNYFEIAYSFNRQFGNDGIYKNLTLYNFVDNHDVNRLASTLNDKNDLFNTYTMLYTMPGIPSIYYGSEMGIEGMKKNGSDAALRPCIELDKQIQNTKLTKHIEKLGLFKQSLPVLSFGDYQQVYLTNEQFVFSRTYLQQHFYAAFNTSEYDVEIHFTCKEKTLLNLWDDTIYNPENDTLTLFIPSKSSLLLINDKHSDVQKTTNQNNTKPSQITSIPIGLYEHFKGKQYRVLHIAKHSETEEAYVVYQQMYGNKEIWIRPLSMFIETIDKNGEKIPRFKYIGE